MHCKSSDKERKRNTPRHNNSNNSSLLLTANCPIRARVLHNSATRRRNVCGALDRAQQVHRGKRTRARYVEKRESTYGFVSFARAKGNLMYDVI